MSTDPVPLIAINAVSYLPDGLKVLSDVSFTASERRIGIVGRNGSGKTSFARVMAGLVAPDRGQVRIGGVDVVKDRKGALGAVGILFQNPDHQIIFPTVEEEIAFGLTQMGQSRDEAAAGVAAMLERFGKPHWAKAAVHQLSQGQRQLVCLMSVLAMKPKLIILDEPFAGLDIPTTLHLRRVLDAVEMTLVVITHDPDVVRDYDRVLWIDGGEVAQDGGPNDVLPTFEARMNQIGEEDDLAYIAG